MGWVDDERTCFASELARAEAIANEGACDPTAQECFDTCAHAMACQALADFLGYEGADADALACEGCGQWDELRPDRVPALEALCRDMLEFVRVADRLPPLAGGPGLCELRLQRNGRELSVATFRDRLARLSAL